MLFCPECGTAKAETDEIEEPIVEKAHGKYDTNAMLEAVKGMEKTSEALDYFVSAFADGTGQDIDLFMQRLKQNAEVERVYGSSFSSTLRLIETFISNDMRVFSVDTNSDSMLCPVCSTSQRSDRLICRKCSALFRPIDNEL